MLNRNSQNDSMVTAAGNLPRTASRRAGAFESEALLHLNDLYRTALHMIRQSATASDAVRETYLRAWKAFGECRPDTSCKVWLFQILINVVRHERRSVSTISLVPMDFMEVLLLVDGQGFSYRETAEILGVPTNVVARRVVLGRNHLHSELEAGCSMPVAVAQ